MHSSQELKSERRLNLARDEYILVIDWKMKWLAMVWRETQQEWFGKSGIPWHGGMAIWRENDSANSHGPDDYCILLFDFITDNRKEDGFSVYYMVEGVIRLMKEIQPPKSKSGIESDGAGC